MCQNMSRLVMIEAWDLSAIISFMTWQYLLLKGHFFSVNISITENCSKLMRQWYMPLINFTKIMRITEICTENTILLLAQSFIHHSGGTKINWSSVVKSMKEIIAYEIHVNTILVLIICTRNIMILSTHTVALILVAPKILYA